MKYSKAAMEYINSEHIRFLSEDNKIPTLEERVMAAFDEGVKSVHRNNWHNAFGKLNAIASDKCNINFPKCND
jgi:hypothetical protein